ncbi:MULTISPECIES: DMT family transporter [Chelativorans]|jgi:drug/metabolite transporter (DMT)-like permease|uniref:EamA domain-containing protein n=1 Tax=Chelativorans sp. (strain BNC1) TaxID=266779 RepID=Q11DX6_CHESB|nr:MULTISPECIES: DMT family transporter [Chelativorans]
MPQLVKVAPALFVILWSTGFIGARYAMPWAEPFTFLWVRFALSVALLLLLMPIMGARPLPARTAFHSGVAGVLMHGIYLGGVFWAVHKGLPAGLAGLIVGLQPLLTALMAGTFTGEEVGRRHWLGLVVGLVGVAIVLSPKLGQVAGGVTPATIWVGLAAVIAMSAGTVWQKRFVGNADLISGTLCQYLGGFLFAFPISLLFETRHFVLNGEIVFAMLWLVIVLSLGAVLLLMLLIRKGAVGRVASLFYLVPAVTAVMAWALFGETLTLIQIGGMAITTLGVALATAHPATARLASR